MRECRWWDCSRHHDAFGRLQDANHAQWPDSSSLLVPPFPPSSSSLTCYCYYPAATAINNLCINITTTPPVPFLARRYPRNHLSRRRHPGTLFRRRTESDLDLVGRGSISWGVRGGKEGIGEQQAGRGRTKGLRIDNADIEDGKRGEYACLPTFRPCDLIAPPWPREREFRTETAKETYGSSDYVEQGRRVPRLQWERLQRVKADASGSIAARLVNRRVLSIAYNLAYPRGALNSIVKVEAVLEKAMSE
jgi:hypothetical protein